MSSMKSSAQHLRAFVERIEAIRAEKKELSVDEAAVKAEAKSEGFDPKTINYIVKRRAAKPHDLQEAEALAETYMVALGMASDTPLFRAVGLLNVDAMQRDAVADALGPMVPLGGSITIETGTGRPIRIARDKDGEITVAEVQPPKAAAAAASPTKSATERAPAPEVDAVGAENLGRAAFRSNVAIIANPFPFGDARRARWDFGWRAEGGGDGMGPED